MESDTASRRAHSKAGASREWFTAFIVVGAGVFLLKLWLAYSTKGAPDISAWRDFLDHIRQCGVCVYQTGGLMLEPQGPRITPFNHPPFVIHYLRLIGNLSRALNLDFAFVFRTVTSCFDIGSAVLVYKLLHRSGFFTPIGYGFYLLAPATIIISGYHGNTDAVMIFFVLLAAFLIERPVLAGLAFGMALSIKIVPIVFVAAFIFYLPSKQRLKFIGAAVAIAFALALPFIAQDPLIIIREVLGYGSFPGRWGWTRALFVFIGRSNFFFLASRIGGYLLLAYLWYLSFKMGRNRIPLFLQLGLIGFLLMAFTPSWGTNYMSWLDPFAAIFGPWPALTYYSTSGALLGYLYLINSDESTRLIGIAWLGVLLVTSIFLRKMKRWRIVEIQHFVDGPDTDKLR
jgi:hypothetical protein